MANTRSQPSLVKPSVAVTPGHPRNCVQARLPDGRIFEAPPGATLCEFMCAAYPDDPWSVVGAVVNAKLRELTLPLQMDANVVPVRLTDIDGVRIYRRSLTFLLVTAAAEVHPDTEVLISHSAYPSGYYCEVRGRAPFTQTELDRIEERMRDIVAADEPFTKALVPLSQAIDVFRAAGEGDKVRLMAHRHKDTLTLYALCQHRDYFQGYMLPSTGYLRQFALHAFSPGFILRFPRQDTPCEMPPIRPYPKIFAIFEEAAYRLDRLGIRSVGALNDAIVDGYLPEIALIAEGFHGFQLARITAELVAQRERIKIVLIAGPSASAKTTFSKRLAIQLLAQGLRPYPISLDDYFVNREQTPRDANGEYDYESLRPWTSPCSTATCWL